MLSLLTGKIKIVAMGMLAALLPILYILGRKDGTKLNENKYIKHDLEQEIAKSEFYKSMESDEITSVDTRDELVTRLRDKGL
jgi:hypothetical protein|tara:strand:+ start:124 stop:369 length:246 start_codon:yes stop_codon:yes gene_type:complete